MNDFDKTLLEHFINIVMKQDYYLTETIVHKSYTPERWDALKDSTKAAIKKSEWHKAVWKVVRAQKKGKKRKSIYTDKQHNGVYTTLPKAQARLRAIAASGGN